MQPRRIQTYTEHNVVLHSGNDLQLVGSGCLCVLPCDWIHLDVLWTRDGELAAMKCLLDLEAVLIIGAAMSHLIGG